MFNKQLGLSLIEEMIVGSTFPKSEIKPIKIIKEFLFKSKRQFKLIHNNSSLYKLRLTHLEHKYKVLMCLKKSM